MVNCLMSLGNNVHDFDELTARRQGMFDDFMKEAKEDPTRFSPVVPYEAPSAAIIGRVFELRWLCDEVDANEVKTGNTLSIVSVARSQPSIQRPPLRQRKVSAVKVNMQPCESNGIAISKCITVGLTVTTF